MAVVTFGKQADALVRKSLTFQARNWRTNCCLLVIPLFFLSLLLALQLVLESVFNDDEFRCSEVGPQWCAIPYPFSNLPFQASQDPEAAPFANQTSYYFTAENDMSDFVSRHIPPSGDAIPWNIWIANNTFIDDVVTIETFEPRVEFQLGQDSGINETPDVYTTMAAIFTLYTPISEDRQVNLVAADAIAFALQHAGVAVNTQRLQEFDYHFDSAFVPDVEDNDARGIDFSIIHPTCDDPLGAATLLFDPVSSALIARSPSLNNSIEVIAGALASYPCITVVNQVFDTVTDLEEDLFENWRKTVPDGEPIVEPVAAFDFRDSSDTSLNAYIYFNDTNEINAGGQGLPFLYQRTHGTINMLTSGFVEWMSGGKYSVRLRAVRDFPKLEDELDIDISSLLGPLFYAWIFNILFPAFLNMIVYEKQGRLRIIMKMMGLEDSTYWTVTYLYMIAIYSIYAAWTIIVGVIYDLNFFTLTDPGIQIVFYFLWGNLLIAFAFVASTIFDNAKTANVSSYLWVLGTGFIAEFIIRSFIENPDTPDGVFTALHLIPPFALYRGLWEIAQFAFAGDGLKWDDLSEDSVLMDDILIIFVLEWIVFMVLALYLDQISSTGPGVAKHPLFFLDPIRNLWTEKKVVPRSPSGGGGGEVAIEMEPQAVERQDSGHLAMDGSDVRAEQRRAEAADPHEQAIVVRGLSKTYPGVDGQPPKTAVHTLSFAVSNGECMGLLGPNGAGKTTCINMLCGFARPSGGTATVGGHPILSEMDSIYSKMGVCPQHDLLWHELTAREHLKFYGRLKNLSGPELVSAVDEALEAVNLLSVGDKQAGKFSGGMKRRLSVAISLIGKPSIIYLDEPSTGLDPASRQQLWAVIRNAKRHAALILTTHSMEEAERLCDRLAVFVHGRLSCVGKPIELKARFAGHYVLNVVTPPESEEVIVAFVQDIAPDAERSYVLAGSQRFHIAAGDKVLSKIFSAFASKAKDLGVIEWGIANGTLEDALVAVSLASL